MLARSLTTEAGLPATTPGNATTKTLDDGPQPFRCGLPLVLGARELARPKGGWRTDGRRGVGWNRLHPGKRLAKGGSAGCAGL